MAVTEREMFFVSFKLRGNTILHKNVITILNRFSTLSFFDYNFPYFEVISLTYYNVCTMLNLKGKKYDFSV